MAWKAHPNLFEFIKVTQKEQGAAEGSYEEVVE